MSGHSKWANIKARKGSQDAKRGKMFTKLAKEIIIAARLGGGDESGNPRLRTAIQAARAINMPRDNINRAIKRGTGELEGAAIEEVIYEGYGPSGVAILVEATSDNKNRTTGEIRHLFTRFGGNLGVSGCVARLFEHRGLFTVPAGELDEETVFEAAIDAGAEDMESEEGSFLIYSKFEDMSGVGEALEKAGIPFESMEGVYIPVTTTHVPGDKAKGLLKLIDSLDDNDDVVNVWSNMDIDDSDLEALAEE